MMTFTRPGQLTGLGLLRFSGADAMSFLQGQVSNDTGPLAQGSTVLCAYSSAQGRVIAILTLIPHSTGILAVLPLELVGSTAQRLTKFILRSKVRIEDLSGSYFVAGQRGEAGLLAAGLAAPAAPGACIEAHGISVARLHDRDARYWVVGPNVPGPSWLAAGDAAIDNAWRLADIRAGLPQVHGGNSEEFVAQMLNLDLVNGISFTKGCYTGQEIIARTQHLGRIKRRMFRVQVAGDTPAAEELAIGATLRLADGRAGRVCEFAQVDSGYEALAVLPLERSAEGADRAVTSAALLDLPYPL